MRYKKVEINWNKSTLKIDLLDRPIDSKELLNLFADCIKALTSRLKQIKQ